MNEKFVMRTKLLFAVFVLTFSCTSLAMDKKSVLNEGPWVGAALGFGFLSESVMNSSGINEDIDTNRFNGKVDMGYDVNQYFGVYGSYDYAQHTWLGNDLHLATIGLKGREYLTDKLSLFGKVGATYLFSGDNDSGLIGSFGLGLEYQLTHAVAVRIGADYYNDLEISRTQTGDLTQIYWGMSYRFGQPETPLIITKTVEVVKEMPVEVIQEMQVINVSPASSEKLFSNNSSLLMSTKSLEYPLEMLKKDRRLNARIVGYTDSTGSEQYNLWMSKRRAKSVADYFILNGIEPSRVTSLGKGEDDPIADNSNELGRAQNRRVELTIE